MQTYRATLSRSQGRSSWNMIFRHPLRETPEGKPGRRYRRGLGTEDEGEAQGLVDQMNTLLKDQSLWILSARDEAATRFDERIVRAFYDDLVPAERAPWALRDSVIPLPDRTQGYSRALLLGTTGAGKTTLVRQLIGTDPKTERFPSTAAARTTVADTEIVTTDGPEFSAVVTFLTREQIRQNIEESVIAAVLAQVRDPAAPTAQIAERLLVHPEQRFRLRYILGDEKWLNKSASVSGDFFEEDEEEEEDTSEISDEERYRLARQIMSYVNDVQELANTVRWETANALPYDPTNRDEQEAFEELLEEEVEKNLREDERFQALVDAIFDDVETRFELVMDGILVRDAGGFPSHWTYLSEDRDHFLRLVNRYSSNYAPNFGRLLTPLVEGIRVAGPFRPFWAPDHNPHLVLLDGEGMGHTTDSASTVPTRIRRRYEIVDAVLLVDNAAQPLQVVPTSVLKSLGASGYQDKLILCFTHFEAVQGPNIPTIEAKKAHVMASLENVLSSMGATIGRSAENSLRRVTNQNVVFLAKIDKAVLPPEQTVGKKAQFAQFAQTELRLLLSLLSDKGSAEPPEVFPNYDASLLLLNIQNAVRQFYGPWLRRLGRVYHPGTMQLHWATIKALSRRYGAWRQDQYGNLSPVSDLVDTLSNEISRFLDKPERWNPGTASEEKQDAAITAIRQHAAPRIEDLARQRLLDQPVRAWFDAYMRRGTGSTRLRAADIEAILKDAAPLPGDGQAIEAGTFVREIRAIVKEAVEATGGTILGA